MSNLSTQDKRNQGKGKPLLNAKFDARLAAWIVESDAELHHGAELSTSTYGLVSEEIYNERNVGRSRIKASNATFISLTDKGRTIGSNELDRFARSWVETRQTLDHQTIPALGFYDLSAQIESINPTNNLWKVRTASAFIPLVQYITDDELGLDLVVTEEVIDITPPYTKPVNTPGAFYTVKAVDEKRGIKTTVSISGYPATSFNRTTYEQVDYNYPSILVAANYSNGFITSQRRSIFKLDTRVRKGFQASADARIVEQLLTATEAEALRTSVITAWPAAGHLGTDTTRASIFTPKKQDIRYDGVLFSVALYDILHDNFNPTANSHADDTYYGAVNESPSFPATNITATQYLANIGNEVCIQDFCKPWRYGLFWRRRVYIKLQ